MLSGLLIPAGSIALAGKSGSDLQHVDLSVVRRHATDPWGRGSHGGTARFFFFVQFLFSGSRRRLHLLSFRTYGRHLGCRTSAPGTRRTMRRIFLPAERSSEKSSRALILWVTQALHERRNEQEHIVKGTKPFSRISIHTVETQQLVRWKYVSQTTIWKLLVSSTALSPLLIRPLKEKQDPPERTPLDFFVLPLWVKDHFAGVTMNKAATHLQKDRKEHGLQRTGLNEYAKREQDVQFKRALLRA